MHFKYIWFYFQVIFHMYVLKKNDNISIVSRVNYAWVNKTVFNIRLNKLITDPFFNHHKNEGGYNSLSPWQALKMKNGTPQTFPFQEAFRCLTGPSPALGPALVSTEYSKGWRKGWLQIHS